MYQTIAWIAQVTYKDGLQQRLCAAAALLVKMERKSAGGLLRHGRAEQVQCQCLRNSLLARGYVEFTVDAAGMIAYRER